MENKEKMYEEGLDEAIAFIDRLVEIAKKYEADEDEFVFKNLAAISSSFFVTNLKCFLEGEK